jgi:sugar phosphate isomerase/epimerase
MFKLSYSCNSADLLPIEEICERLWTFGYSGVELSFQHGQFDPMAISDERVAELRNFFATSPVKPVCISTATTKFLSEVPHEPSLLSLDIGQRALRDEIMHGEAMALDVLFSCFLTYKKAFL